MPLTHGWFRRKKMYIERKERMTKQKGGKIETDSDSR